MNLWWTLFAAVGGTIIGVLLMLLRRPPPPSTPLTLRIKPKEIKRTSPIQGLFDASKYGRDASDILEKLEPTLHEQQSVGIAGIAGMHQRLKDPKDLMVFWAGWFGALHHLEQGLYAAKVQGELAEKEIAQAPKEQGQL